MDRQRGLSPAPGQPRLQGLGLGGLAASGRPSFSQQKPGLPVPPPGLLGSSLRPGSLGNSSRLGSTGGGGRGALPLRSVGRHSLDADCAPPAAAGHKTSSAAAAAVSSCNGAATCQPSLLACSLDAVGLTDGNPGSRQPSQQRRRESAPAAGLLGVSAAAAPGGRVAGGRGGATGLPLRSHMSLGFGGMPGSAANNGDGAAYSSKPPQPQIQIQWLPPVPGKHGPDATEAPKPAKQRARPGKQVQWLLPEREMLKEQEQHQPGNLLVDEAQQQQPPLKRQRLESAAGAPARRLGGLRQPAMALPPPLLDLSYNVAVAGVRESQALTHGSSGQPQRPQPRWSGLTAAGLTAAE